MHTKRIARGARWLDKQEPDWFDRIHPYSLDPDSDRGCIIGQVFGSFERYWRRRYFMPSQYAHPKLELLLPNTWVAIWLMARRGFATVREGTWPWIEAWKDEIDKRKKARDESEKLYVPTEWVRDESLVS